MACVAYGCKSHSSHKSDEKQALSFHRFPEYEILREAWIKAIHRKNWQPSKSSRLCSKHFTPQCYLENKKRKLLRRDAIPTIFKNYPQSLQKESSKLARNQIIDWQRNIRVTRRNIQPILHTTDSQPSTSKELCELAKSLTEPRLDDTPRNKELRKALVKETKTSARRLKKLRTAQQKYRRVKRKLITLERIVREYKSQKIINEETALINDMDGENNEDFLTIYLSEPEDTDDLGNTAQS